MLYIIYPNQVLCNVASHVEIARHVWQWTKESSIFYVDKILDFFDPLPPPFVDNFTK